MECSKREQMFSFDSLYSIHFKLSSDFKKPKAIQFGRQTQESIRMTKLSLKMEPMGNMNRIGPF